MDEYYDPKEEYIKKLETLASYDSDDRPWIKDYKERESWEDHKNYIYFG